MVRDWKETLADVLMLITLMLITLMLITLVLFGVAIGIGMCKFWPEFWWFINWGGGCMSLNNGMFTSNTDLWSTPQELFDKLDAQYNFETDVCALPENAKCKRFFTPEMDGLKQEWTGVCWMNPPYGRQIGKWVRKAYESARDNLATVVCLLPARTDTAWFHDYVQPHACISFVRGRIKFGGQSMEHLSPV